MKKELSENDIKYPILSMLFDGPEELAARAEALRDSIIWDLEDDSHPRIRQLEIISELLRPNFIDNNTPYQHALHQVALADLSKLINSSEQIDDRTKLFTTIEQAQKLANQLSFTIDVSLEHTEGSLSWTEETSLDSTSMLDTSNQTDDGLLDHEMLARLAAKGHRLIDTKIRNIHYRGGTLSINGKLVLNIKPSGVDSRFLGLFFRGPETLKKRDYQLGDIVTLLKDRENKPNIETRQLYKRYSDARIRINRKVKAETGIDELIHYRDMTYSINQDLL